MSKFKLEISYSQIAVFNPMLENPFNNWTEEHFNQGFVWRPQSVSFRTVLAKGGNAAVSFDRGDDVVLRDDAVIAIAVPFDLQDPQIEIASVFKGEVFDFEPGEYELVFQHGRVGAAPWCDFTFVPRKVAAARILRPGNVLQPGPELIMTAEPA
jgi:hypothetical protein